MRAQPRHRAGRWSGGGVDTDVMTDELPLLAVSGATGVVGGLVARNLASAGLSQRLLVRDPARAPQLDGAVALPISYADSAACDRALAGVEILFMVSGAEAVDRLDQHRTFVDAAAAAGVRHIVYTSFVNASPTSTFTLARDHYATEEYIKANGMTHTFLRDNIYLDFMEDMVGDDGVIRGPADDGRAAMVARLDVARVASSVLLDPPAHADAAYDVTGPEALTLGEVAEILSTSSARTVTFHDETIEEAYASRQVFGAPGWQVDAWVSTYQAIAAGELQAVSNDVERVTGTPPISLADFLAARS
jgi:NAD(P)H dehydrogenase (quinone)